MVITIMSPMSGEVIPIDQVPDPVFAEKMLGDGVAIIPDEGVVAAPAAGIISALPKSGHAFGMELAEGVELLVHVGIDTVEMNGEGFTLLAVKGQQIELGQRLIAFDINAIKAAGKPTISPIVVMGGRIKILAAQHVKLGEPLLEVEIDTP